MNNDIFVVNKAGERIYFEGALEMMDDGLRIYLSNHYFPCSPQEFFTHYEEAHWVMFNEDWELSKPNSPF